MYFIILYYNLHFCVESIGALRRNEVFTDHSLSPNYPHLGGNASLDSTLAPLGPLPALLPPPHQRRHSADRLRLLRV